jgi:signal peptidase
MGKNKTKYFRFFGFLKKILFLFLFVIFLVLLSPNLPTKQLFLSYVVPSGSMVPTIPVGSVVFTQPVNPKALKAGDVISFVSPNDVRIIIVHRILAIDRDLAFHTKGDSNNAADSWKVQPSYVTGKYLFNVPVIGYLILFIRTKIGFVFLLLIPAVIYSILQVKNIFEGINEIRNRNSDKKKIAKKILAPLIILLTYQVYKIKPVQALFNDSVSMNGVSISTQSEPEQHKPAIVINELMIDGSKASSLDFWIELFNPSDEEINISGWKLTNVLVGKKDIVFENGTKIKPFEYFLISRNSDDEKKTDLKIKPDLVNDKLFLIPQNNKPDVELIDQKEVVIDIAPVAEFDNIYDHNKEKQSGHIVFKSIQRKIDSGNGLDLNNWGVCEPDSCSSDIYWKQDGVGKDFGTPGSVNLFETNNSSQSCTVKPEVIVIQHPDISTLDLLVGNIYRFSQVKYSIEYQHDDISEAIVGTLDNSDKRNHLDHLGILLGTCSGDECVIHRNAHNVKVEIELTEDEKTIKLITGYDNSSQSGVIYEASPGITLSTNSVCF